MTRTCRTCGANYADSVDGRLWHKKLFDHAPSPERTTFDDEEVRPCPSD